MSRSGRVRPVRVPRLGHRQISRHCKRSTVAGVVDQLLHLRRIARSHRAPLSLLQHTLCERPPEAGLDPVMNQTVSVLGGMARFPSYLVSYGTAEPTLCQV